MDINLRTSLVVALSVIIGFELSFIVPTELIVNNDIFSVGYRSAPELLAYAAGNKSEFILAEGADSHNQESAGTELSEEYSSKQVPASPTPPTITTDRIVYASLPGADWVLESWGAASNFSSTLTPSNSVSLHIQFAQPWSGLLLRAYHFDTTPYNALTLSVLSPAHDIEDVDILFIDENGESLKNINLAPYHDGKEYSPNTWATISIPLSNLRAQNLPINGIAIQSSQQNAELFVGDIYFERLMLSTFYEEPAPKPASTTTSDTLSDIPGNAEPLVNTPAPVPTPIFYTPTKHPLVFSDSLEQDWIVGPGTWGVTSRLDTESVFDSTASLQLIFDKEWASLHLYHKKGGMLRTGYQYLTLLIKGVNEGRQEITVKLLDENGEEIAAHSLAEYLPLGYISPNSWDRVHLPLREINPNQQVIREIVIQSESETTVNVDDIRLTN